MLEVDTSAPLREQIKHAPEFTQPYQANTLFGDQEWPFEEVEVSDDGSRHEKVVFEAKGLVSSDSDAHTVRVIYEDPYGLGVKRTVISRHFSENTILLMSASLECRFGDVDIVYATSMSSPFVTERIVSDKENFKPTITVNAKDHVVLPLAHMDYRFSNQVPWHAGFSNADYDNALVGEVETRDIDSFGKMDRQSSHTYFAWEHLLGAKVGVAQWDDPFDRNKMTFYRWLTQINATRPTFVENTPYAQKLTRTHPNNDWGKGRLRFSRMNLVNGESWMFSVPEAIDLFRFNSDIQHQSLRDFFWSYPVVFCVKQRGEERNWNSTHSTIDKAKV